MLGDTRQEVTLIGHALVPTGRGEDIRCVFRALQATGGGVDICDVPCGPSLSDIDIQNEIGGRLVDKPGSHFNIFVINGMDVEWVLDGLGCPDPPPEAINIVFPQWELSRYPREWARQLNRFDEVWAPTRFVFDALQSAVSKPVFHLPYPVQVNIRYSLGRKYFDLPERAFLFMFIFDFGSYVQRKNPGSVIKAFRLACDQAQNADFRLVIKMSGHHWGPAVKPLVEQFMAEVRGGPYQEKIILIDRVLTDTEMKNLIQCSDCFVSLHRSEGLGRGLAEAMYLRKPVIATGYSGNLDFMNEDNSYLVKFRLVKVPEGGYLFPQSQVWADPDVEQAAYFMLKLYAEPHTCARLGQSGSRNMMTNFGYVAVGHRYRSRLHALRGNC